MCERCDYTPTPREQQRLRDEWMFRSYSQRPDPLIGDRAFYIGVGIVLTLLGLVFFQIISR